MAKLRKLLMNYSLRALGILGVAGFARYLFRSVLFLPRILKERDLRAVDRVMGKSPIRCHMYGKTFQIDAPFADSQILDGTFTFGIIRELYFRNCYLRAGLDRRLDRCRVVLDLGANRGIFSTLLAQFAEKIICVEVLPEFVDVIRRNMEINGFKGCHIETLFIGAGGEYERRAHGMITMEKLLEKYGVEKVDLLKMDIEGSEFSLFQASDWLVKVEALCMEVHPGFGRVQDILDTLQRRGFQVEYANSLFHPVSNPQDAEFIWAQRPS